MFHNSIHIRVKGREREMSPPRIITANILKETHTEPEQQPVVQQDEQLKLPGGQSSWLVAFRKTRC